MSCGVNYIGLMAPSPIIIRKSVPASERMASKPPFQIHRKYASGLTPAYICTAITLALASWLPWARRWLLSGCALETLALMFSDYGSASHARLLAPLPLWTCLTTLNLIYAVCSTSWLLLGIFTAICYPLVLLTCLCQFETVANVARQVLRRLLVGLHFTRDKIALFNLPALEIDTDVDGLFVIRGVTISLSRLTIEAHGIELGIRLTNAIELAMYVDQVKVSLFRRIEVGDVYANIKGGKAEMTFGDLEPTTKDDDSDELFGSTVLLRAATVGSEGFKKRPKLRESLTGTYTMQDSSARAGLDSMTRLSPDDTKAEKQYMDMLTDIRTTSAVYQSRQQVRKRAKGEDGFNLESEKDMRAAICAELHALPTIVHPPQRSVRVTTLQKLSSPRMRVFMHRMPFLLRLLLNPLSYFHPITFSSINAAGSGKWLSALLQEHVFKHYATDNAEIRRLERRINAWLESANFCCELTDISAIGQVPMSTAFDIVAYLNIKDIMAYRTVPDTASISQVVALAGANATFTIPSFLLPHHEHLIPPPPTPVDEELLDHEVEEADGLPKTVQKEHEKETVLKDEAAINMSVHGSLPATADQSLLNFIAALVKATKIIELEKDMESDDEEEPDTTSRPRTDSAPAAPITTSKIPSTFAFESDSGPPSPLKLGHKTFTFPASPHESHKDIKSFARHVRNNLSASSTKTSSAIASFAKDLHVNTTNLARDLSANTRDLHQSAVEGMKKAVVGVAVNDRWIARMVGKLARLLETAQGDLGYSGEIKIALGPYRLGAGDSELSKLMG